MASSGLQFQRKERKKKPEESQKGRQYVYFFGDGKAEGSGTMRELLGGKGAGLAEMTNLGIPVPPGFTITTEACVEYYNLLGSKYPEGMVDQASEALKRLEFSMGKIFGDPNDPLLLAVRSGSRASMPGMMDTLLNVGLTPESVQGLARKTGNERFAWDSYRRFVAMFGSIVMGVSREFFEAILKRTMKEVNAQHETNLEVTHLQALVREFKLLVEKKTGKQFPDEPSTQLQMAIQAVFASWNGDRAQHYRRIHSIPDSWGTAVNVMAMVFGNMGETSGTGVAFTRDPNTGERTFFGECLMNAQGEDVVAGIRTPLPLTALQNVVPEAYAQLLGIFESLESHYRDMLDLEFTIQEGKLYMLQTRVGKRTGIAAVRIAVGMAQEGLISKRDALKRVAPEQLEQYLYPIFDAKEESKAVLLGKGLPAGPGAAVGEIALSSERAVEMRKFGKQVVLVRQETSPDDIHGMDASAGFLTARGGMTSHAAVVARQMGKVCVAGCGDVEVIDPHSVRIGNKTFREGDYISLNGSTGNVYEGNIPVAESEVIQVIQGNLSPEKSERYQLFSRLLAWADAERRLEVRANADLPEQAKIAKGFGAKGIGLCRSEHMFVAKERLKIVQAMILARTKEERETHLAQLLPLQKQDFIGLYREMQGYPVTIRLLDPPLHEFLPKREELMVEIARLEITGNDPQKLKELRALLARIEELHEFNPMLGLRGCRLGITMPEITHMQVRAIFEAACELAKEGVIITPEIMIPLVGMSLEMISQRELVHEVAEKVMQQYGTKLTYLVGTMIELPRAAMMAGEIAEEAQFFSFGTNDLTQTTYGFSRDDSAKFFSHYKTNGIMDFDPFATIDRDGVGDLMKIAITRGRSARPDIKLGVCGEHGGDPKSIEFFHQLGLDYVSCSPYRVPIARLAAAHAALKEANAQKERTKNK